jgi:hypothetical protein
MGWAVRLPGKVVGVAAAFALRRPGPREGLRVAGAAGAARIVEAGHERLVVTYSVRDATAYVLTPPGEEPGAVLRAARLVLPDEAYEELASRLGAGADWAAE